MIIKKIFIFIVDTKLEYPYAKREDTFDTLHEVTVI